MLYKSIIPADLGVKTDQSPHLISARAWITMGGMRALGGEVTNFPGWTSIFAVGTTVGGQVTLIASLERFDNSQFLVVGGPSKVYRYNAVAKTLTDISGAVTFVTTLDEPWWPFMFGDNLYIVNKNDGLYKYTGTGNLSLIAGASKARSAAILKDHICLFNLTGGFDQTFLWGAEGSDSVWTALATNDAGEFDLKDSPGQGVALYRLGNDLIAYKDDSITPITFVGGNEVFGRRQAIDKIGLLGQFALANLGTHHIGMSDREFFKYDGGSLADTDIGEPIRNTVYDAMSQKYRNRCRALWFRATQEVLFMYPAIGSVGELTHFVVYNVGDKSWYGPTPITQGTILGSTRRSLSMVIDEVTDVIDTVTDFVDSDTFVVGSPMQLFGDMNGLVHDIGASQNANGVAITRNLESGDHFLGIESVTEAGQPILIPLDSVFSVNAINIETKDVANDEVSFYIGSKMELNDAIVYSAAYTVKAHSSGVIRIPVRGAGTFGRWFRIKLSIPNSRQFGLYGYQYEFVSIGRR